MSRHLGCGLVGVACRGGIGIHAETPFISLQVPTDDPEMWIVPCQSFSTFMTLVLFLFCCFPLCTVCFDLC